MDQKKIRTKTNFSYHKINNKYIWRVSHGSQYTLTFQENTSWPYLAKHDRLKEEILNLQWYLSWIKMCLKLYIKPPAQGRSPCPTQWLIIKVKPQKSSSIKRGRKQTLHASRKSFILFIGVINRRHPVPKLSLHTLLHNWMRLSFVLCRDECLCLYTGHIPWVCCCQDAAGTYKNWYGCFSLRVWGSKYHLINLKRLQVSRKSCMRWIHTFPSPGRKII